MYDKKTVGKKGEDIALEYLLKQGLVLLDRNWHGGHLELDLVMEDKNFIRFVEVKTITAPSDFDPFEEMTALKQRRVMAAAKMYAARKNIAKEMVFDVVGVKMGADGFSEITYIPDAFLAMKY